MLSHWSWSLAAQYFFFFFLPDLRQKPLVTNSNWPPLYNCTLKFVSNDTVSSVHVQTLLGEDGKVSSSFFFRVLGKALFAKIFSVGTSDSLHDFIISDDFKVISKNFINFQWFWMISKRFRCPISADFKSEQPLGTWFATLPSLLINNIIPSEYHTILLVELRSTSFGTIIKRGAKIHHPNHVILQYMDRAACWNILSPFHSLQTTFKRSKSEFCFWNDD